jgi:hypothetical protein
MAKILITVSRILNYSGSELVVLDLARYLVSQRHKVTVATSYVHPRFDELVSEIGVSLIIIKSSSVLTTTHFDIIWSHHSQILDICLLDLNITGDRVVFSSLSPFVPEECPPIYASNLTFIITNSQENKDVVIGYGYEPDFIKVLPNPVPDPVFILQKIARDDRLSKIGIVTNHLCSELSEAVNIFRNNKSIIVDIYGIDHDYRLVTPELLLKYDLIVTIGRTVQSCIVLGLPIYCYDHFGGPGYLSAENYKRAAYFNFSGRCSGKKDVNQICFEILDGYAQALNDIQVISASSRERYRLSRHVDHLLSEISTSPVLNYESMGAFQQALRARKQNHTSLFNRCTAELYWIEATDDYYNEHQKVSVSYSFDQRDVRVRFIFPNQLFNIRALRLDICDKPGGFLISGINLQDENGKIIWIWDNLTEIFFNLSSDFIRIPAVGNSEIAHFVAIGNDPYFRINIDTEVLKRISSRFQLVVSFKTIDLSKVVIKLQEELDSLNSQRQRQAQVDHLLGNVAPPSTSFTLLSELEDVTALIAQALSSRDQSLIEKSLQINRLREELTRAEAQLNLLKDVLIHNLDEDYLH